MAKTNKNHIYDESISYRERLGHKEYTETGLNCSEDEPITEQHHKDDCDINVLMKKYIQTGEMPDHVNRLKAAFGDFSNVPDYHQALNAVIEAKNAFMELPPDTRKRFDNDPGKLLEFIQDERNNAEAIKLGLKTEIVQPAPPMTRSEVSVSTVTSSKAGASPKGDAVKAD